MIHLTMKKHTFAHYMQNALTIMAMLILSASCFASPKELMSNLHQMRLLSSSAVANYHLFAGLDGDAKYGNRLQKNLTQIEDLFTQSSDIPAVDSVAKEFGQIRIHWQSFKALAKENYQDMMKQGFPNVRVVTDMDSENRQLIQMLNNLYAQIEKNNGIQLAKEASLARDMAMIMQQINTQYAARGSNNLGQVFSFNFAQSLETLAAEFNLALKQLKAVSSRPSDKALLAGVNSKWLFINRSIANYNENSVVFLVSSYSDRIIMNLEKIAKIHSS